jgi:hypothetical protein
MNNDKDDMRDEYRREDLGHGVRGKYFKRLAKGFNLVLPGEAAAQALSTAETISARKEERRKNNG